MDKNKRHNNSSTTTTTTTTSSNTAAVDATKDDYPELKIVFEFFTDNPQKVMPGDVNSPKKDSPYYDPYWEAIRCMQESNEFLEGILLRCVDCNPRYPFIHYIVYKNSTNTTTTTSLTTTPATTNTTSNNQTTTTTTGGSRSRQTSGGGGGGGVGGERGSTTPTANSCTLAQHDTALSNGRVICSTIDRNIAEIIKSHGGYRELHTFVDRQTPLLPKRPSNPNTAYIVSAFMTSGNLDNLDKTWSYWSGADYIVENIPPALKLERVTFHKSLDGCSAAAGVAGGGPRDAPRST